MVIPFSLIDYDNLPPLILKTANGNVLGTLGYAHNINLDVKYNETSELTFTIPAQVDGKPTPNYDAVIGMRNILIPDIAEFVICNPKESTDGVNRNKEVHCYSLEYEFTYKYITLEEGTYQFYDPNNEDSILHIIMDLMPSWHLGTIDEAVLTKFRTFSVDSENLYNFIKGTVQQTFECIFDFNTLTRTVNVRDANSVAAQEPVFMSTENLLKNVDVSEDTESIITRLWVHGAEDVNINRVNPIGQGYLLNLDYFMNTDHFDQTLIEKYEAWKTLVETQRVPFYILGLKYTAKNTEILRLRAELKDEQEYLDLLMQQLGVLLQAYQEGLDSQKANLQAQIDAKNTEITAQKTAVSTKESEIATAEQELAQLQTQQQAIVNQCAYETYFTAEEQASMNYFIKDGEISDDTFVSESNTEYLPEETVMTTSGVSTITVTNPQVVTPDIHTTVLHGGEISITNSNGNLVNGTLQMLYAPMPIGTPRKQSISIPQWNYNTSATVEFTDQYALADECTYSIEYTAGEAVFSSLSVSVRTTSGVKTVGSAVVTPGLRQSWTYTASAGDFTTESGVMQHIQFVAICTNSTSGQVEESTLSVTRTLTHVPPTRASCFALVQHAITIIGGESKQVDTISLEISGRNSRAWETTGDSGVYTLSYYDGAVLYQTNASTELRESNVAWDLLEFGRSTLAKLSQPTYTFDLSSANFLALDQFKTFKNALSLGERIYLQLDDDRVLTPLCIGANMTLDSKAALTMEFGNTFNTADSSFQLVDLLEQSISMGKNLDSSKYTYASFKDSGASTSIKERMTNALDVALQNIVSSGSQSVSWDLSGLHLRKESETVPGVYEDEQMWINNNSLLLTTDGWQTAEMAIGKFYDSGFVNQDGTKGAVVYGICAPMIMGAMITGGGLRIEANDGSLVMDENGCTITDATLTITTSNGRSRVLLDPNNGLKIQQKPLSSPIWENKFYADTDGNLHLAGALEAATGTFTGTLSAVSGTFSSLTANGSLTLNGQQLFFGATGTSQASTPYIQQYSNAVNLQWSDAAGGRLAISNEFAVLEYHRDNTNEYNLLRIDELRLWCHLLSNATDTQGNALGDGNPHDLVYNAKGKLSGIAELALSGAITGATTITASGAVTCAGVTSSSSVWAGKWSKSTAQSQEYSVSVNGGAGRMFMFAQAAVSGNRGIWALSANEQYSSAVFAINQQNQISALATLNCNLVCLGHVTCNGNFYLGEDTRIAVNSAGNLVWVDGQGTTHVLAREGS